MFEKGRRARVLAALDNLRNWCMRAGRQLFEHEQLFMGRYSVADTADWGVYTVMISTLDTNHPCPSRVLAALCALPTFVTSHR